jgi:hypothetical protein
MVIVVVQHHNVVLVTVLSYAQTINKKKIKGKKQTDATHKYLIALTIFKTIALLFFYSKDPNYKQSISPL